MPARGFTPEDYLTQAVASAKERYQGRNNHIELIRDWRRKRTQPKTLPRIYESVCTIYHPPDVEKLIHVGQALIAKKLPTTHRAPTDLKSVKSRQQAEQMEIWFYWAHLRTLLDINWWAQVTDSLAEGPIGVWKTTKRTQAWGAAMSGYDDKSAKEYNEKWEKTRRDTFPFVNTHVPSMAFQPLAWGPDGAFREVLEITEREKPFLADMYKDELKSAGMILDGDAESWGNGSVECWEFWNEDSCEFWIDQKRVYKGEHKGKEPPYFQAQFSTTNHHDPAFESECLVDPILDACEQFQDFSCKKSVWAHLTSYPGFKLETNVDNALPYDEGEAKITWGPNLTTKVPTDRTWNPIIIPGTGQDLNQLLAFHQQTIERNSLATVLYGEGSGEMSGPVQHTQVDLAYATFGPCLESLARAFNRMDRHWLKLIVNDIKASVPVQQKANGEWIEIGPDDIEDVFDVQNEMDLIIRMAEVVAYTEAKDQQQSGYVTEDYVRRTIPGVKNPEAMADAVAVEKMANSNQMETLQMAHLLELEKADQEDPPPTVEEITGQAVPGQGTPAAPPGVNPGNLPGGGVIAPPGMGQQPVNPGMPMPLRPG